MTTNTVAFCARGVLMRADAAAVDVMPTPVEVALLVSLALQLAQHALPHTLLAPAQARGDTLPRPEPLGDIAPRAARAVHPQDALHHQAMVLAGPPATRVLLGWQ